MTAYFGNTYFVSPVFLRFRNHVKLLVNFNFWTVDATPDMKESIELTTFYYNSLTTQSRPGSENKLRFQCCEDTDM